MSIDKDCLCLWNQRFMERGGIVLNTPQDIPVDPYTKRREFHIPSHTTPSCYDRRGKFLAMDGKVHELHPVTLLS